MIRSLTFYLLLSFTLFFCISCASRIPSQAKYGIDKFALIKKQPIHYIEVGNGPPIILIPGLFGTYRGWNRIIPHLAAKFRLLAIDNFGTGESGQPVDDFHYSVAEQADVIVALMDELKISRCDLIGGSYGGMIALNIAARYPDRVSTVVSIEGAVIMPKNSPYRMLEHGLNSPIIGDAIISLIRSGWLDETITRDIMGKAWTTMDAEEQAEITDIISNNVMVASRTSWLNLAHALNNAKDFTEDAKGIKAPVLYLSGDKSSFREMTDINIAYFKDNLPNVQVISFEDGIHDLQLQKPKETAAMISHFIEENVSRSQNSARLTKNLATQNDSQMMVR
jgi:pimeloyl-ACP methyl ester carboxylesterase